MTISPAEQVLPIPPNSLSHGGVSLRFTRVVPGEPSRGLVPYYHFRIISPDGVDVGHINFRVGETEHVVLCVGHIGFEILEMHRGHGHALRACRAIAPFVSSIYDAVTLTCDPENHASRRTIEKLGARFIDQVAVPPYDPHYHSGSRCKRRYRWEPVTG